MQPCIILFFKQTNKKRYINSTHEETKSNIVSYFINLIPMSLL